MPSECAADGCSEKLTKESKFSLHAGPVKNEAKKRQWQVAVGRWDAATKTLQKPKHHDLLCVKHFEKEKLHILHTAEHSVWAQLKDEAVPTLSAKKKERKKRPGLREEHWQNVASER